MKMEDHLSSETRAFTYPLQTAIQKNVLVNVTIQCRIESAPSLDLVDHLTESLEEDM